MSIEQEKPRIPPGLKAKLLVYGVAFLMVLVPFLFWKDTWFGTVLSEQKVEEYLKSSARPRVVPTVARSLIPASRHPSRE